MSTMPSAKVWRKVNVIGHVNPDTDSICSAIAYAYLKNQASEMACEPRRAGQLNRETEFVLKHFGVNPPRLCTDVSPQIKDIDIRQQPGIDGEMSLKDALSLMRDVEIDTLCITDPEQELLGLITVRDIANANMDMMDTGVLADAKTSYKNVVSTLDGEMIVGDPADTVSGHIYIGGSPDVMEEVLRPGDLVLVPNRYDIQLCAIECQAGCIVICNGKTAPRTIEALAREKGCRIILTPHDTYGAARLVSQSAPVRHFMQTENLLKFNVDTPIEDARRVMASVRHRYFPILDNDGKYCGVVSRRNLLNLHRKQIILVDHNEKTQAVDGVESAEILEIIDHHKLGTIETISPVFFRNQPLGCTGTIVYQMYREAGIQPEREIAGLLCSAIISDTLLFRSPTCTEVDKRAALELAEIAGIQVEKYAGEMFAAASDLKGKTEDEIFYQDFKRFTAGKKTFGVGQISSVNADELEELKGRLIPYARKEREEKGMDMMFFMLTNILTESTDLICEGQGSEQMVASALHGTADEKYSAVVHLPGVVSRKKQLIPSIMLAVQN